MATPASGGRFARREDAADLLGRARHLEQVALTEVAAQRREHLALVGPLDALRDGLEMERPGDVQDRADERFGVVLAAQPLDEAAVDLQDVDREALQIAQRAVAGAE